MRKNKFWLNFIIRAIFGWGVIALTNYYFQQTDIALKVGLNAVSFLTTGILGLPGVALLYGIVAIPVL